MTVDILIHILAGLLLGGIVNVLADNLPQGRVLSLPRYRDGRVRPLAAWLGLGAFLFQLRRSSDSSEESNASPLSWRYPLTELALTALLLSANLVGNANGQLAFGQQILQQIYVIAFVLLAVVDIEHRRILFFPVVAACLLALVDAALFPQQPPALPSSLAGGAVGGIVFSLVYAGGQIYARLRSDGGAMPTPFGKGDIYLMVLGGLVVGFPTVLALMVIAVFLGGLGALAYIAALRLQGRRYEQFTVLPYGPYLLAATYLLMLFPNIIGLGN